MSRTIIDNLYKSKDLRNKFFNYYSPNSITENKKEFVKIWSSVCDKFSFHFLFEFFDSVDIKIGILPLPNGEWGYRIINEKTILISNDFKTRAAAIEQALNKSIEIYDNKRTNN